MNANCERLKIAMIAVETFMPPMNYGFAGNPLELIAEAVSHNPDVILAPEFFLYSGGRPAAEEKKHEIIQRIADIAGDGKRLIIPGTLIWQRQGKARNTALIIAGDEIMEYHKTTDGGTGYIASARKMKPVYGNEKGKIFNWGGLDVGLELCSDHWNDLLKSRRRSLDIQAVIGCGMDFQDTHSAVRQGGYALNCDGHRPDENNEALRKCSWGWLGLSPTKQGEIMLYTIWFGGAR